MKKLLFYFIAASVTIVSCNRNDDDSTNGTESGGSATLTAERYGFDGASAGKFTSQKAGIVKTSAAGNTILTISAVRDGGNESINIVLYGEPATNKTYTLGNGSQNGIIIRKDYLNVSDQAKSYSTDNNGNNMTGGGEVKITALNGNTIEGTFYAVGFNNAKSEAYAEQGKFSGTVN